MPSVRLTTDRVVGNYLQRADDAIEVSADEAARLLAAGQAELLVAPPELAASEPTQTAALPAAQPKPPRRR